MAKFKSFDDIAAFISLENNKINQSISTLRVDLMQQIKNLTLDFDEKLERLTQENLLLRERIHHIEDSLERNDKSNQLVIRGIPVLLNEDLQLIFSKLCSAIGYDLTSSSGFNIYRVIRKSSENVQTLQRPKLRSDSSNTNSKSKIYNYPSIIVTFLASWDKSSFFYKYLNFKHLNVKDLGIDAINGNRIYISDNLTKKHYEIFRKCNDLKKNGKIAKISIKKGLILVCCNPGSPAVYINTLDDLTQLCT